MLLIFQALIQSPSFIMRKKSLLNDFTSLYQFEWLDMQDVYLDVDLDIEDVLDVEEVEEADVLLRHLLIRILLLKVMNVPVILER